MLIRLIGLSTVSLLVAAWVAGGVNGAASATVTIRDGRLAPAVARIDGPGKVTWSNQGAKRHVVASLSGSFQPLVLKPGQRKSVTFSKRRCERYTVDGALNGRVLVGVSACAAGTPPAGGTTPGGTSGDANGVQEDVLRYDIVVTASLHQVDTYNPANDPPNVGTHDLELSWTGTWRKHELIVTSGGGSVAFYDSPKTGDKGTVRGRFTWSDTRPSSACSGKIDFTKKGHAVVQGRKNKGDKPGVSFDAQMDTLAYDLSIIAKQDATCGTEGTTLTSAWLPSWEGTVHGQSSRFVVLGVSIDPPSPDSTHWFREGGSGTPFPLDRILAHRAFTIDSGIRRGSHAEDGHQLKFTGSVKYVFTPVP